VPGNPPVRKPGIAALLELGILREATGRRWGAVSGHTKFWPFWKG